MTERAKAAKELFGSSFNCAQSVVAPFSEKYGLDKQTVLKIASGFGGGVRRGEVCGAVTGAVMVIGLKQGQYKAGDTATKGECNASVLDFLDRFESQNGALTCRDLLGCDISTEQGKAQISEQNMHEEICEGLVKSAVELLENMGY